MAQQLFEIIRGTDKRFRAYTMSGALYVDGSTFSTFNLYVAKSKNSSSLILNKTLTVDLPQYGSGYYDFVPADTVNLNTGDYWGETGIVTTGGKTYRSFPPFLFRIVERVKA